jgi:hypothetical protein
MINLLIYVLSYFPKESPIDRLTDCHLTRYCFASYGTKFQVQVKVKVKDHINGKLNVM